MLKLFVGNLPPDTGETELRALFAPHGRIHSLRVATDVFTGRCRGFGFVEMEGHEARAAIAALNGRTVNGQSLKVNLERPRTARGHRR